MEIVMKSELLLVLALFACLSTISTLAVSVEGFSEELTVQPLCDGKLSSTFEFKYQISGVPRDPSASDYGDGSNHYSVFPLPLGQILHEFAVTEFHYTLNSGTWDYSFWGYPFDPGVGPGAEIWAWMGDDESDSIDHRWKGFRNALSGLFCASIGSVDDRRTTSSLQAFVPEGLLPNLTHGHRLRHIALPSESVCTENLTPFVKLLPCKASSGIASLLNPHRLFGADWHGMGVHVVWLGEEGVQVRLTFQAVFDPVRHSTAHKQDWSFQSLFDRRIVKACPVSYSSRVSVVLPAETHVSLLPDPSTMNSSHAVFDVLERKGDLDVMMEWPQDSTFDHALTPVAMPLTNITMSRTLRGSTQDRGELMVSITNHLENDVHVLFMEAMPRHLHFYLHTLHVYSGGIPRDDVLVSVSYVTSEPSSQPTALRCLLKLPPTSTIILQVEVAKSFLGYTEHLPDAHRGWDLPPALLVQLTEDMDTDLHPRKGHPPRIYSSAILLDLASPDFSMPYNVIILTCSLMAFVFGSVFNLLHRKFVVIALEEEVKGQKH